MFDMKYANVTVLEIIFGYFPNNPKDKSDFYRKDNLGLENVVPF